MKLRVRLTKSLSVSDSDLHPFGYHSPVKYYGIEYTFDAAERDDE